MRARAAGAALLVAALAPAAARAASTVTSIYPVSSLGADSATLGIDVDGPATQVMLDVTGVSAAAGNFAAVRSLVVSRDPSGSPAFHTTVLLSSTYPADGVLTVTATPLDPDGSSGSPLSVSFDAAADPPSVSESAAQIRTDASGSILVTVDVSGPVASAELRLMVVAASKLRTLGGSLQKAQADAALALTTAVARQVASDPEHVTFAVPTGGAALPGDGLVIGDVAVVDPFGRTVHTSLSEFVGGNQVDSLVRLDAQPSPRRATASACRSRSSAPSRSRARSTSRGAGATSSTRRRIRKSPRRPTPAK
jgi:hypothetical protein